VFFKNRLYTVTSSTPLALINWTFVLFLSLILFYGASDFIQYRNKFSDLTLKAAERVRSVLKVTTDDILTIMKDTELIYSIDPLLESKFTYLKEHEGIHSKILHPPTEDVPAEFQTTPEKVKYWIEKKGGKELLEEEDIKTIQKFLDLLKERERKHPESAKMLESVLSPEKYTRRIQSLETEYVLTEKNDYFKVFVKEEGPIVDAYATFYRNHEDCKGCHGYDKENPILIHFFRDSQLEIDQGYREVKGILLGRSLSIVGLTVLYFITYLLLKKSIQLEKQESNESKEALVASADVLSTLSSPPRLIPNYIISPIYRKSHALGGGDSTQWINFRKGYAGFCLQDVSGHGIKETVLNIFASALSEKCKINETTMEICTPSQVFTFMNDKLLEFCRKVKTYNYHFITSVYLLFNFENKDITMSLAGHPFPFLIRADGKLEKVGKAGFILGQFTSSETEKFFYDTSITLQKGELLLIYSDGLMEQLNRKGERFFKIFNQRIVLEIANKDPHEAFNIISEESETHASGVKYEDDISFLVIGPRPEDKYKTLRIMSGDVIFGSESMRLNQATAIDKVIDLLHKNGWFVDKMESVRFVIKELSEGFCSHQKLDQNTCRLELTYILHMDIIELKIGCGGECVLQKDLPSGAGFYDLLSKWNGRLYALRRLVDEIYLNESGNICWALVKKES